MSITSYFVLIFCIVMVLSKEIKTMNITIFFNVCTVIIMSIHFEKVTLIPLVILVEFIVAKAINEKILFRGDKKRFDYYKNSRVVKNLFYSLLILIPISMMFHREALSMAYGIKVSKEVLVLLVTSFIVMWRQLKWK